MQALARLIALLSNRANVPVMLRVAVFQRSPERVIGAFLARHAAIFRNRTCEVQRGVHDAARVLVIHLIQEHRAILRHRVAPVDAVLIESRAQVREALRLIRRRLPCRVRVRLCGRHPDTEPLIIQLTVILPAAGAARHEPAVHVVGVIGQRRLFLGKRPVRAVVPI